VGAAQQYLKSNTNSYGVSQFQYFGLWLIILGRRIFRLAPLDEAQVLIYFLSNVFVNLL
jgi:hypothetical protein